MRKLNFGCGKDVRKGWDNCDIQKEAPISFNFNKFPYPLKKNYYDYLRINSVLDYVEKPEEVLNELWKHSAKEGIIEIWCGYWNCIGSWNLLISKGGFSRECFLLFIKSDYIINQKRKFKIELLELIPTTVGKWIYPKCLREKLSLFFGGIISQVHVKLKVIK